MKIESVVFSIIGDWPGTNLKDPLKGRIRDVGLVPKQLHPHHQPRLLNEPKPWTICKNKKFGGASILLFLPEHVRAGGDQHGDGTLDFENLFNEHIVELLLLYYGLFNRMDVPQTVHGPNLITRLVLTSTRNLRALSGHGTMVALILPCA